MKTETQNQRIDEYLRAGHRLTSLKAFRLFGTMRLASRISDLKHQGRRIVKKMITVNTKFAGKTHVAEYGVEL